MRLTSLVFRICFLPVAFAAGGQEAKPSTTARDLFEARRYAEAQAMFEEILEESPNDTTALKYLGRLAAKRQDRNQAVDYLGEALKYTPEEAELHFEYGAACGLYAASKGTSISALNHAYKARKHLRHAIELQPDNLTFRQGLIEFCVNAPDWIGGGVEAALEQATEIGARDTAKGIFAQASIHRSQEKHAAAMESLAKLIALSPDNYWALFQFGRCAAESGERLDEAYTYLKKCLGLPAPDQAAPPAEVWWNIATIETRRNNREAAIAALEQAVNLAPHHREISEDLKRFLAAEA